ncbi:MAG: hypothetical protein NTX64_12830 [Elusimicrobia bacterium]|nr:hypothetical protein [Elusimicrobiota bacterium]
MSPLDELVAALFDYAGMFPPASLPFEEALKTSAGLRRALRRPGMVAADFVCGLDRLGELTDEKLAECGWSLRARAFGGEAPRPGGGSPRPGGEGRRAVSYEAKCLPDFLGYPAVKGLEALRAALGGSGLSLYLEPECTGADWPAAVEKIFRFLDRLPSGERPGLKLRCSGPAAIGPDDLARVVAGAVDRGLRLKASAGLHHPVVGERCGNRIGFLGLALSVRLRRVFGAGFSVPAMAGCMTCATPTQFTFADGGAAWLNFRLGKDQLAGGAGLTIGSCSLQEPDDGLARLYPELGWLAAPPNKPLTD